MNKPLASTVAMQMTQEVKADLIAERVIAEIADMMGMEPSDIKLDARITEDLGADSLDRVEILMALENEFEVEIFDDQAEQVHTVQQAVDLVKRLID